jgi:hypothetical protein
MDQGTERRIVTQRIEDLQRLARKAEDAGVRVLVDYRTGQHVATSSTDASACYLVSVEKGCSCKGFATWGRCCHHSLLLAECGLLEMPAERAPVPVITVDDDRRADLAERRYRAEQARQRLAARAADPAASDRALAECTAARAQRMAIGLSIAHA